MSKELPELRQVLAKALRGAFEVMQITLREYARRHHLSVSVVSRYLSGNRLPSKDFIEKTIELAGTRLTAGDATTCGTSTASGQRRRRSTETAASGH
ncbi:hypothetical protein [Streptomyces sp. NPDC017958]|uniref:hypothetical protein n=1 Tax=Streptomyces sp. NPDC017958 TaxID=3365021 RepID=UPI0037A33E52